MVAINSNYVSPLQSASLAPRSTQREEIVKQSAANDAELVRRFRFGDEEAFAAIVARYRDKMFSIAFGYLHNHADAEEIAQDTLIRAHRGLARFRGDSSLATWLHRIASNLSRNRYRHNYCRRRHLTLSLDCSLNDDDRNSFADLIACDRPSPAREATACEFSETVVRCMDKLGSSQRAILLLRNSQNRSYGEIARALGINIGTVKSRIARARKNLREMLAETYPEMAFETPGTSWFEPIRPSGRVEIACA